MSFALTTDQFLNGSKTVTRRIGWRFLTPGTRLMACRKCMGLRPGETLDRLGELEVVEVRRERLDAMHDEPYGGLQAGLEGFPNLSGREFVEMFCRHMRCNPWDEVTVIRFYRPDLRAPGAYS